jgi:glycosyltransferase involved in cell wall biosynthesis
MRTIMTVKPSGSVSVVIPCYNAAAFVADAIRSAYGQTISPREVIVVDDGSSDDSVPVLESLRATEFPSLIVLFHPQRANWGVSSTRQRGVCAASSEYVAFLDADDQFLPTKLERQIGAFADSPDAILCHTDVRVFGDLSETQRFEHAFNQRSAGAYYLRRMKDYTRVNAICNSSVLVKRDALRKVPMAMPQRFQFEDWACWLMLSRLGPFVFLNEPLTAYRLHEKGATAKILRSRLEHLYSVLEMQLALVTRSHGIMERSWWLLRSIRTLIRLLRIYGRSNDLCRGDGGGIVSDDAG